MTKIIAAAASLGLLITLPLAIGLAFYAQNLRGALTECRSTRTVGLSSVDRQHESRPERQ